MSFIKDVAHYLFLIRFRYKYKKTKIVSSYFSEKIRGFYSQEGQDAYIYSEFFSLFQSGKLPKIFVDIGCNHPIKFSNSIFFEKHLGFHCIAVDPLTTYVSQWAEVRPNSKLHSVALSSSAGRMNLMTCEKNDVPLHGSHSNDMFSTLDPKSCKAVGERFINIEVPVLTAQEIFNMDCVSEIGIISIDVEGFELEVLKGINFSKTNIYIAVIENNTKDRYGSDEIRKFMIERDFSFYARLWGMDDVFINNNVSNFYV